MKKTYLKYFLAMFAIISILYLTACGGGGGGGNSVAPTPVAPSVRIIVDGSIFGDLASIRVSNRKIAEDKQFVSDPLVKKRKFQNERTYIKPIKGVEDKNDIKLGKISNFKKIKALFTEKKQIVNEAKKANLSLPLIIKTTAYSNGKPVAGVVIDDRTATASGTNYVCDITGLNNIYDYRFAAYYNDKLLIQKHAVSLDIANGKDVYLTVYDHYKAIAYDAWVAMQPNGGTIADFLKYCQQAGIDVNKSDAFVFLCNISLYDYKNALQTIVKGGDSSIPTVKNVDIGKIISNISGDNTTPDIPIQTNSVDVAFTIASNAENIVIDGLYKLNPNFNISFSSSYAFNDSDKTKILNAITVSNITNDKVIKIWNENDILLSFTGNLAYNATYTISMASITDIDGVNITSFNSLTFTTIDKNNIVFTIVSNNENIISENLYKLNPDFTISFAPNYDFNETNKVEILNAISVSEISGDKIVKSWNDNNIALSFTENLAYNTNYTISMSAVSDIEGINITCFDNFSFTTVDVNNFSFSISYNLNGGVVASANPTGYNIDTETFALNNPTKEGYTFTGWTGSNGDTPQTTVSIAHGSTGNKTYTANWSVNSYSVAVNMGSGISAVTGAGSYEYGANVVVGYTLANGYAFSSWTGDKTESTFTMPASDVTMQANAVPISYSVSYNLNGGTVSVANPTTYDVTSATITLNNPTKDGYTFTGWIGSNGAIPQTTVTISHGSIGDKAYIANYSCADYSISYNLNGGSVAFANPTGYNIASETFVLNNPTKEGYTFTGWTGSNGDTPQTTVTISQGSSGDKTYTANWSVNSYSVAVNKGAGISEVTGAGSYEYGANVVVGYTLANGYAFSSWTGDKTESTFTMPASDVTMQANAAPISYSVSYNLNGGSVSVANPTSYDVTSATITLNNPTKDGYTFTGWIGSNGAIPQTTVTISHGSIGDKAYIANYSYAAYSISYNLNGGSLTSSNPSGYNIDTETFALNNPTKEGYTFTGWTGSNGDTPQTTVTISQGSTGDKTYTANWSVNSYSVAVNMGSGVSAVTGAGSYEYGANVVVGYTLANGYAFSSWTGDKTESTFTMPASNVTMQANAIPISYSVSYNLNGGSVSVANPTSYDITSATITLNNPTKEGYTFTGWTGSNGVVPQTTVTIAHGSTGDKSYAANYSYAAYSISYNLNGGSLTSSNPIGYNIASETFALNNPTKEGYTFTGWTGSNGDTPQTTVTISQGSTGDKTYTANWSVNSYSVAVNMGAGVSAVTGAGSYEYGANVVVGYTLANGYEFSSWTGDKTESTFTMPASNVTMQANATPISYTISYNLNGGSVSVANPTSYDVTSATIILKNPTKDGYTFTGWIGTDIAEGTASDSLSIPLGSTGNRSYIASWTADIAIFKYDISSATITIKQDLLEPVLIKLKPISHGTFTMGSSESEIGRSGYETRHQVTISNDYWIGIYEVTQAQYEAVMGTNPSYFKNDYDSPSKPVESISWNDAKAFCAWLNEHIASSSLPTDYYFDLPTEAQWEYACRSGYSTCLNNGSNVTSIRGGNGNLLPDTNLDELGWYFYSYDTGYYSGHSDDKTHSVGTKSPNRWGLYDMHGNVQEWCRDWYHDNYYTICGDCEDPVGPESGSERVLRGGSFYSEPVGCRSASRYWCVPSGLGRTIGFRIALVKN